MPKDKQVKNVNGKNITVGFRVGHNFYFTYGKGKLKFNINLN